MSQLESPVLDPVAQGLPAAPILARIRRLLFVAVFSGVAYTFLLHASKGFCPGGIDADGAFMDATGNPVANAPACVSLTLQPDPLMYVALIIIILAALNGALKAPDTTAALRVIDRSAAVMGIVVVASIVIAQLWFSAIPITDWSATRPYTLFYPFPFGTVDLTTSPMTGP